MPSRWGRRLVILLVAAAIWIVATRVGGGRWARPLDGTSKRQIVVGGTTRTYLLHAGGEAKAGRPLVLVLHGLGDYAASLERRTRGAFDKLADQSGAVVVYPQGSGARPHWGAWVVGAPGAPPPPDDLGFLSALIDSLGRELAIDRTRVFAVGFSNGASMVYRLACERPDLVAAVAPVSGAMMPDVAAPCRVGAPVSLIGMHGTADPTVAFDASIRDGIATWAQRDGCPPQPATSQLADADPHDGTLTHVDAFEPCAAGTAVAFYTIDGGGHTWPGEYRPFAVVRRAGNTARDFDAATVIWTFFQRHPKR